MNNKNLMRIKLPDFSTFKSTRQDTSPYELFHFWVAAQVGGKKKNKKINVSASWLHPKDAERLDSRTSTWLKKAYPIMSATTRGRTLAWHRLDVSPANWTEKDVPEGVEPGYVYVDKKTLYEGK